MNMLFKSGVNLESDTHVENADYCPCLVFCKPELRPCFGAETQPVPDADGAIEVVNKDIVQQLQSGGSESVSQPYCNKPKQTQLTSREAWPVSHS